MKHTGRLSPVVLLAILSAPLFAAEPALKPQLGKTGKLLLEENFSEGKLSEKWAVAKGKWEVNEKGALAGSELVADQHAAVLTLKQPNRNSIVQFDFTMDGVKQWAFSLNHASGHLWRLSVTEAGLSLMKDKDKKDPASKPVKLATSGIEWKQGETYTMQVEIVGPKVLVRLADGSATLSASHPALDTDKPNYRFVTRGESLLIKNVKVWSVAE